MPEEPQSQPSAPQQQPAGAPVPTAPAVPTVGTAGLSPEQARDQQARSQQGRQQAAAKVQQEAQARADSAKKKPVFRRIYHASLGKGALCLFQYLYMKHDAYPMVLVTSIYSQAPRIGQVAGLNLHYLTFRYVKFLLKQYCGQGSFSYQNIKGDQYIVNAFRTYKRDGIRNLKMIDCQYLIDILGRIRSFKPTEVKAIREEVERQLGQVVNRKADDVTHEKIWPQAYEDYDLKKPRQDGRFNPKGTTPIEKPQS